MTRNASPTDAQPLDRWLQGSSALGRLLSHSQQLLDLNRRLTLWLAEPWAASVRIADLQGETLIVFCDTAAALTRFRYRIPETMIWLRKDCSLPLTRIEAKVRPKPQLEAK